MKIEAGVWEGTGGGGGGGGGGAGRKRMEGKSLQSSTSFFTSADLLSHSYPQGWKHYIVCSNYPSYLAHLHVAKC